MFTEYAMKNFAEYMRNCVKKVSFKMNEDDVEAEDLIVETIDNNIIRLRFLIHPKKACKVSQICVFGEKDELWYSNREALTFTSSDQKIYHVISIGIEEVKV